MQQLAVGSSITHGLRGVIEDRGANNNWPEASQIDASGRMVDKMWPRQTAAASSMAFCCELKHEDHDPTAGTVSQKRLFHGS